MKITKQEVEEAKIALSICACQHEWHLTLEVVLPGESITWRLADWAWSAASNVLEYAGWREIYAEAHAMLECGWLPDGWDLA